MAGNIRKPILFSHHIKKVIVESKKNIEPELLVYRAKSAGTVKYADSISAEGYDSLLRMSIYDTKPSYSKATVLELGEH